MKHRALGSVDCGAQYFARPDVLALIVVGLGAASLLIWSGMRDTTGHRIAGMVGCGATIAWSLQPIYLGWPIVGVPLAAVGLLRGPADRRSLIVSAALAMVAAVVAMALPALAQRFVTPDLLLCR